MKSVIFRADASLRIGSGHVMRCLALADGLKSSGAQTLFISRDLPGNVFDVIRKRGHSLVKLAAPDNYPGIDINQNDYASNLGVPWEEDAQETLNLVRVSESKPDWLIVDHYALDRGWQQRLRPSSKNILVIDDMAKTPQECDLLLNENFLPDAESSYERLVPQNARLLLGPKYALLRTEFREARKGMKPRGGRVKRILVFYGGVDPSNETGKTLEALAGLNWRDIHVDVVIGSANPYREIVQAKIKQLPDATLHTQLPHLADLMNQADLALSAGGSTIWELLFFGVPALVTTTADNQVANVRSLNEHRLVIWLGYAQHVGVDHVKNTLREMLIQVELLHLLSEAGWEIVDGRGVDRLLSEIGVVDEGCI